MKAKYRAKKVKTKFGTFDSKREYNRYLELKAMEEDGLITNLRRQVKYELLPSQREPDKIGPKGGYKQGKVIERAVYYIADFVYEENGVTVVEDNKGFRTHDYILKRKLLLYMKGIRIKET